LLCPACKSLRQPLFSSFKLLLIHSSLRKPKYFFLLSTLIHLAFTLSWFTGEKSVQNIMEHLTGFIN
jgi:hypothetical protein